MKKKLLKYTPFNILLAFVLTFSFNTEAIAHTPTPSEFISSSLSQTNVEDDDPVSISTSIRINLDIEKQDEIIKIFHSVIHKKYASQTKHIRRHHFNLNGKTSKTTRYYILYCQLKVYC